MLTATSIVIFPSFVQLATSSPASLAQPTQPIAQNLLQQGRALYEAGQFTAAAEVLQRAVQTYQMQGNTLQQAIALSNLALTYQQLGAWTEANQAITTSLDLLQPIETAAGDRLSVLAQSLQVQGRLQLAQGQTEQALATWEQAATLYQQLGDSTGKIRNQINQAQALQTLGLYRRSIALLTEVEQHLADQPDSLEKAISFRSLGNALQVSGAFEQAETALQQSQAIGEALGNPEAIAAAQISLGNVARAQAAQLNGIDPTRTEAERTRALEFYRQAATQPASALTIAQAQLNQLSLLIDLKQYSNAQSLIPPIQTQLGTLPPGRPALYAQINFAQSLSRLKQATETETPSWETIAQLLATANQQAEALNDTRQKSYALGNLGGLYEQTEQWENAQTLTRQALGLAQSINASDIAYQWEWQLGRVLKAQGKSQEAIAAYDQAFKTLQSIRRDLVTAAPDVQFSFRTSVEPVYRQLIDLLLTPQNGTEPSQDSLGQAREVLESLQVVELENFLRQACLDATSQVDQVVDQEDPTAAVIYPIILDDRLEVVLKLPGQGLYHYPSIPVSRSALEKTIAQLQLDLQEAYTFAAVKAGSQQIYDWLVRPAAERLKQQNIQTLVFVLDGAFRSIPMAALYDGQQYLIEQYGVAVSLGLEIREPKPIANKSLNILAASLTDPPAGFQQEGFAELEYVNPELDEIANFAPSVQLLRDQNFTKAALQQALTQTDLQVVHLATHGQFGIDRNSTFLLAADGKIGVDELGELFRTRDQIRSEDVELLILSACETATGDDREVLGIAGTAVRSGARSTIASLWSLDDESSVEFTKQLYQSLGQANLSRAQALRRAQQALLNIPDYEHPRYWAPYVLVGNWL